MILRLALLSELPQIWNIIQFAIEQRRLDGSTQWQNGYPNEIVLAEDIQKKQGYVLENEGEIIAYAAIIFDIEPAYTAIEGKWLTTGEYVVIHRVATSKKVVGKGIGRQLFQMIEDLASQHGIFSIKVDTNFDNVPMLKILDKLQYTYCGQVYFSGSPRRAFEKVLK
ncbi:MAG: GNAT family N-acetyltransferase [Bacteroidota bacterium]